LDGLLDVVLMVPYHKDVEMWCRSGRDLVQLAYTAAILLEPVAIGTCSRSSR